MLGEYFYYESSNTHVVFSFLNLVIHVSHSIFFKVGRLLKEETVISNFPWKERPYSGPNLQPTIPYVSQVHFYDKLMS